MSTVTEKISTLGVVPVVVLEDAKDAAPLAKALVEGGLPCAEVTFRTDAAEESIKIMTSEYPDMFVGAGTVLTIEQVDRAVAAGAKFIVSPGFDPEIVDYCLSKEIPIFPGCITPSEVRKKGYALDDEENELGVRCIAVSIPDYRNKPKYAFSISAPVVRMSDSRIQELSKIALEIKSEICSTMK